MKKTWEKKEIMRQKGKISNWNDVKGFGFIAPSGGGKQVFFHISGYKNGSKRPKIDQAVSYSISKDKHGRTRADDVRLANRILAVAGARNLNSMLFGAAFLVVVSGTVLLAQLPILILAGYLILSMVTYVFYAADKSAAEKGTWRIRESTLHLLSMTGGWPGAVVAQKKLHHKTRKKSFRIVFWMTVIVNCGAFVWLLMSDQAAALRAWMSSVM